MIAASIEAGEYQPGDQLPPESQLARNHGVSRFTVRQALASLEAAGVVLIEQGRGTFVRNRVIAFSLDSRTRLSANLTMLGLPGARRLISAETVPADGETARTLGLAPGGDCVQVRLLIEIEGRPVGLVSDHFPTPRFAGIDRVFHQTTSPTEALQAFGVRDYRRVTTRLQSRLPSVAEARLLGMPRTHPLIVAVKQDVDPEGHLVSFGCSAFCADRVGFVVG
ncbi:phosphonate metabolism transcriptional regulator PhnF [Xinfangfangia sp. D13-10-4-6]|nr:phosphonate metabolism transcriptional regulator PhnF [Pseudogemmobacter hezensis]